MNISEFSREFDLLYNNATSNAAPALDEYEKSVFLTESQEELVTELYTGRSREFNSFEGNEELRKYLDTLVTPIYIDLTAYTPPTDNNIISENWTGSDSLYYYRIDLEDEGFTDILYPIYEAAVFDSTDLQTGTLTTMESMDVEIKPVKHTEYHSIIRNPFKGPGSNRIIRLDSNLATPATSTIELISKNPLAGYRQRYIKSPRPIILTNIYTERVTINGIDVATECELPSVLHLTILKKAVRAAAIAYKSS